MLHPVKQGLKRRKNWRGARRRSGCYATSSKTRIETPTPLHLQFFNSEVAMLHPVKQGLKPVYNPGSSGFRGVAMLHPVKQGLKLIC